MVLEKINTYNDVKRLKPEELPVLAKEIRNFLIRHVSETGGHLASNLGTVELTIALHRCLDFPEDRLIFDVGHQSYTHKILTGRKDQFDVLRKKDGLSGFPKRGESICDAFDTGHSSTSISVGLGMVRARELSQEHYTVCSVIGDGSLTGGLAYEALNNAASVNSNFIIILNDNNMSISRNVGGVSRYLSGIRTGKGYNELKENVAATLEKIPGIGDGLVQRISNTKKSIKQLMIPGMLFENMGITYLGPVDGHDIHALIQVIQDAKKLDRSVLIHVNTKKGKGYVPAERYPERFHGVSPFFIENGKSRLKKKRSWSDAFSGILCDLAQKDPKIVGITAAMSDGCGMSTFEKSYPDRFFDVGIAEEHAVTFSAGMAAAGYHPVFAVYSSFLQRAYDQILHDVCIQKLPVIFAIDRAGLVGDDGETHQGVFDIAYLRSIPNICLMAPKDEAEMAAMFAFAAVYPGPCAIRYPKTAIPVYPFGKNDPILLGKSEILIKGSRIAVLSYGSMTETGAIVCDLIREEYGFTASLINLRFAKPLDTETLEEMKQEHSLIVCLEDGIFCGGLSEAVCSYYQGADGIRVIAAAIPDRFIPQASIAEQKKSLKLDAEGIMETIREEYRDYEGKTGCFAG